MLPSVKLKMTFKIGKEILPPYIKFIEVDYWISSRAKILAELLKELGYYRS